jgi:hypothetical protein
LFIIIFQKEIILDILFLLQICVRDNNEAGRLYNKNKSEYKKILKKYIYMIKIKLIYFFIFFIIINFLYNYYKMLNQGINIGHSSRLIYDKCSYNDYLSESVSPLLYKLNPNQINNCDSCLSVFGPRPTSGSHSYGVSSINGHVIAPSQGLTDIESILTNRNVIASRCKDGKVNDIDVTQFKLQHARICNDFLDPIATHLTNPASNYRGMSINRFYNLHKPAQANIFYDFAVNTKLEAKDNYRERIPKLMKTDATVPVEFQGKK